MEIGERTICCVSVAKDYQHPKQGIDVDRERITSGKKVLALSSRPPAARRKGKTSRTWNVHVQGLAFLSKFVATTNHHNCKCAKEYERVDTGNAFFLDKAGQYIGAAPAIYQCRSEIPCSRSSIPCSSLSSSTTSDLSRDDVFSLGTNYRQLVKCIAVRRATRIISCPSLPS